MMENSPGMVNRIEFFVRRVFERIGGAIDYALRRGTASQVGARTDLSVLIAQIERAIEDNLRSEETRIIAPNLIELRYDYETYTQMGHRRREYLERELSSTAYEYIYNRRYVVLDTVQLKIGYDAFTRGLEVKFGFGEAKEVIIAKADSGKAAGPDKRDAKQVAQPGKSARIVLRGSGAYPELRAEVKSGGEPVGVGRNVANELIIKDPTVSNFHAAFVLGADGTLELADRASANGTYVNGILMRAGDRSIVRAGDRVRFGEIEMVLEMKDESEEI
jgi:FHA domain-containing protein